MKKPVTIRLAIAIPTYNEAKNIEKLATSVRDAVRGLNINCKLLIIDDSSPDGTGKIADRLAASLSDKNFLMQVLHRSEKDGFGRAYIAGFKELLEQDFTHILQMDADMSHNPDYIPSFVAASEKADLVVGSRYVAGGSTPDWPLNRRLLSRLGNLYARLILGSRIHDYTGGFNLYTTALLKSFSLDTLQASGYGFLIELKYRAIRNSHGVYEVPIIFFDRAHGVSKMPKSTIFKNLILVPKLKYMNRLKPDVRPS